MFETLTPSSREHYLVNIDVYL